MGDKFTIDRGNEILDGNRLDAVDVETDSEEQVDSESELECQNARVREDLSARRLGDNVPADSSKKSTDNDSDLSTTPEFVAASREVSPSNERLMDNVRVESTTDEREVGDSNGTADRDVSDRERRMLEAFMIDRNLERSFLDDEWEVSTSFRTHCSTDILESTEQDGSFEEVVPETAGGESKTNKVLEIIEMKMTKALRNSPQRSRPNSTAEPEAGGEESPARRNKEIPTTEGKREETRRSTQGEEISTNDRYRRIPTREEKKEETMRSTRDDASSADFKCKCQSEVDKIQINAADIEEEEIEVSEVERKAALKKQLSVLIEEEATRIDVDEAGIDDDDDSTDAEVRRILSHRSPVNNGNDVVDDDASDDSDETSSYWTSNLATIGEEEEDWSEYADSGKPQDQLGQSPMDKEVERNPASAEEIHEEDPAAERMDNCSDGQRLPPDGDEFPTTYQEFNTEKHLQLLSSTGTTTGPSGGHPCLEGQACAPTENFNLPSRDYRLADPVQRSPSDAKNSLPVGHRCIESLDLLDNAATQDVDVVAKSKASYWSTEEPGRRSSAFIGMYVTIRPNGSSGYSSSAEKEIRISGYYHKEVPTELQVSGGEERPPPLPATAPPKIDPTDRSPRVPSKPQPPRRKFSLNGDIWRQDDKSEKSIKDKIAMFSSQSSLEAPIFPSTAAASAAVANGRRLPKYRSTENIFTEDKTLQKGGTSAPMKGSHASVGLINAHKYSNVTARPAPMPNPGNSCQNVPHSMVSSQPAARLPGTGTQMSRSESFIAGQKTGSSANSLARRTSLDVSNEHSELLETKTCESVQNQSKGTTTGPMARGSAEAKDNPSFPSVSATSGSSLTRATSFSVGSTFQAQDHQPVHERPTGAQISRTNSLASTFRRLGEESRRSGLNQLIEQRRKGISKLRGLVIPEKETVTVAQPIIDLPEIKSRNSAIPSQLPIVSIQDKWGSQSSLASTVSTTSNTSRITTSFKIPAPQISSHYSPAFKRKSLTVYGTSLKTAPGMKTIQTTPSVVVSEAPKSLESVCSPTRSDYGFDYASSTSSLETHQLKPRTILKKNKTDYDDSDNDSAVSSSQSSISRGFSPPMSPVLSERSSHSSERSEKSFVSTEMNYQRRSSVPDNSTRSFVASFTGKTSNEGPQFGNRSSTFSERSHSGSERSSSNASSPNPRTRYTLESNSKDSQLMQRRTLRRSSSTETNCSTSSTLTSGSQTSMDSLSRRVLKPQSVEAINRKNIIASARCRSGRDTSGSPLIQRKFSDDEDGSISEYLQRNVNRRQDNDDNGTVSKSDIKIAYIEVTESRQDSEDQSDGTRSPMKGPAISVTEMSDVETSEPSDTLKAWTHTEVVSVLHRGNKSSDLAKKTMTLNEPLPPGNTRVFYRKSLPTPDRKSMERTNSRGRTTDLDPSSASSRHFYAPPKTLNSDQDDLLTILSTRTRLRSTVHAREPKELEDTLGRKPETRLTRSQSVLGDVVTEKSGSTRRPSFESGDNGLLRKTGKPGESGRSVPNSGVLVEEKSRIWENADPFTRDKSKNTLSKIPTFRTLGRKSVTVSDFKEVEDSKNPSSGSLTHPTTSHSYSCPPILDSNLQEADRVVNSKDADDYSAGAKDTDSNSGEPFGSISSLDSTSLITHQELVQLVEEVNLEEAAAGSHDIIVVLLHKENPSGSVGIALAGGMDCETKEITVHRVLRHSIADKDGRLQRGDRILSINGISTRGLTHRESLAVLKQPRSEVVLVVSRTRLEPGSRLIASTESVESAVEGSEGSGAVEDVAWGPALTVTICKNGAGLGFSLEGGKDSPLGDRPLIIKKIFTGGVAEKTALRAGDQLLEVNGRDLTRMSRIEAWSLTKKLPDGEVNLLVRHPATKSS